MKNGIDRRTFLNVAGLTGLSILTPQTVSFAKGKERKVKLYNTHTGERITSTYWEKGRYISESLQEINMLLRDHRTDQVINIDQRLIDFLYIINEKLDNNEDFHVISGYRSPKTNAKLRTQGKKVAKNSFHMYGRAIDIFVPDVDIIKLHKAALAVNKGGVGYYPSSGFIHVDTGNKRRW